VSLLDGTLCYTSDKTGPKKIKIDMGNVESGLHQGLKLMKVGEKAIFILPPHLAHGLTGDNNLIPPKASVFYEIEVTAFNN
jgi:FKBP-type peptidyl-prolyl cis-trans isomerase